MTFSISGYFFGIFPEQSIFRDHIIILLFSTQSILFFLSFLFFPSTDPAIPRPRGRHHLTLPPFNSLPSTNHHHSLSPFLFLFLFFFFSFPSSLFSSLLLLHRELRPQPSHPADPTPATTTAGASGHHDAGEGPKKPGHLLPLSLFFFSFLSFSFLSIRPSPPSPATTTTPPPASPPPAPRRGQTAAGARPAALGAARGP